MYFTLMAVIIYNFRQKRFTFTIFPCNITYEWINCLRIYEDKYLASCVYQLTCLDCFKQYVGQTGRHISKRYKEHSPLLIVETVQNMHYPFQGLAIHLERENVVQVYHFNKKCLDMDTKELSMIIN